MQKEFDEAIEVPDSDIMPVDICCDDLEKGERHIAALIAPVFKDVMKFYQNGKDSCWYYLNSKNLWMSSNTPNEYLITKTVQDFIEVEIQRLWLCFKSEVDKDKQKKIDKELGRLRAHYRQVGKIGYTKQLSKFLQKKLIDKDINSKLDRTAGKFVFNDGILDLRTGYFQVGFRPDDYISEPDQQLHNYLTLKGDPVKRDYVVNQFKKILNNNEYHLEYYLGVIGHALTGDARLEKAFYYIVDGTDNSKGNNGKTFIFNLLERIFPHLVQVTEPKVLEKDYSKVHKHISKWKGKRIIFADEGTKKKLNDSLIKKIGDGLNIENEVMYGCVEIINVMFKMFVCSNHIPKFDDDNEAVFNRYKQIQMCSHFDKGRDEDNFEKLEFVCDPSLGDTLANTYSDEIILLMLDYAKKYYIEGIPVQPLEFQVASNETKKENNQFEMWFDECFEKDDEAKISLDAVLKFAYSYKPNADKKEIVKQLKRLGFKYNKDMRGFGTKIDRNNDEIYIKGGFVGFKERKDEDTDSELN